MTEEEEWKQREEDGKNRFLVPTYTIKDQYSSPDAPFFCAAHYVNAQSTGGISLDESFETGWNDEKTES